MSKWTHINAVIRFDCIRALGMKLPNLGNTCNFESTESEFDNCDVPQGSEGSMQYQIWENPSANSAAGYTVMFWGDLRDYDNSDEIFAYFKKITSGQLIRSGLLEIEVEFTEPLVYRYDTSEKQLGWLDMTIKNQTP